VQSEIGFCVLEAFASVEEALRSLLRASGQSIKKQNFSKHFLARPLRTREEISLPITLVNARQIAPLDEARVRVLGEDADFLALHKPPGVATQPLSYGDGPNLVSWLALHRPALLQVNREAQERGTLWRLDQETSGLVVCAKNQPSFEAIRSNFHHIVKRKIYLAIVSGEAKSHETLVHQLGPHGPRGSKMHQVPQGGALAELTYHALARSGAHTLVAVDLKQGVRHQIRAQLSLAGLPILGDELYGGERSERLFLHCWRYQFADREWQDDHAELFDGRFLDLHRLLQVFGDKLRGA